VRDDRWGPPVSRARRGQRRARLEASSCVRGVNPAGRHRRAVSWAERARWAGREAEAQWGGGKRPVEKKRRWAAAGPIG
jgi:hypothetical protein